MFNFSTCDVLTYYIVALTLERLHLHGPPLLSHRQEQFLLQGSRGATMKMHTMWKTTTRAGEL